MRCGSGCPGPVILAFSLTACSSGEGGADDPARGFSIRDSAGVVIVENAGPERAGGPEWRIDPSPILEIRAGGETPSEPFFEVAGALRLTDGRLVVANGGAGALHFFAPDGAILGSVGGEG